MQIYLCFAGDYKLLDNLQQHREQLRRRSLRYTVTFSAFFKESYNSYTKIHPEQSKVQGVFLFYLLLSL